MTSVESPPLVPQGFDTDVYLVLEEYPNLGRAYREVDEEAADRETLIRNLIDGQFDHPVRIFSGSVRMHRLGMNRSDDFIGLGCEKAEQVVRRIVLLARALDGQAGIQASLWP